MRSSKPASAGKLIYFMTTVRRVRRIIRKIDPWTVLKVSALLNVVLGLGLVLGLVMFWSILTAAGIPDRITEVLVKITLLDEGEDPFANSERFLRVAVFGSVVWAVLSTGLMTLTAVMYNLVTDVVGGVEVVVLEESLAPLSVAPGAPPRRFAAPPNGAVTTPRPRSPRSRSPRSRSPLSRPTNRPKKSAPSAFCEPRVRRDTQCPYRPTERTDYVRSAATKPMASARAR